MIGVELTPIKHTDLHAACTEIWQWMPKAASWQAFEFPHGQYRAEHVAAEILTGSVLLWLVSDPSGRVIGFFTTKITMKSPGKCLTIVHIAGEEGYLDDNLDYAFSVIEDHAKKLDCVGVDILGRPGWGRFVKQRGFSELPVRTYYKEL